jgi:hypothetical protein
VNETSEVKRVAWFRQPLLHLVIGSIILALLLVVIAMALYASSGSAQLDISRPSYKSVQDQIDNKSFESFPATGEVDAAVLDEFLGLYDEQTGRVSSVDAFSPKALEADALGIDAPKS